MALRQGQLFLAGVVSAVASFLFAVVLHAAFGLNLTLATFGFFGSATGLFFTYYWSKSS